MNTELPGTVTIAYVHPNTVTEGFCRSLAGASLWKPNNILGFSSASNPRQTVARNAAIESFLLGPCEWLMWIDTDMTFYHDAIEKLVATAEKHEADAVSGLGFIYKRHLNEIIPNGYMWGEEENAFVEILDYASDNVYEIDGTGSGFVLINRRVFNAWPDKHWHRNWVKHPQTGQEMGHDLAFFYDMTQKLGMKLVWDTNVKTGHIKHMELTEANYRAYQETLA